MSQLMDGRLGGGAIGREITRCCSADYPCFLRSGVAEPRTSDIAEQMRVGFGLRDPIKNDDGGGGGGKAGKRRCSITGGGGRGLLVGRCLFV